MAERIIVTALKPFSYHGRAIAAGDEFAVKPIEAAAFQYQKKVKIGRAIGAMTTRDMRPESDSDESAEPPKSRRRYQRRDMTPEP